MSQIAWIGLSALCGLTLFLAGSGLLVAMRSRDAKKSGRASNLVGAAGVVVTGLTPEGAVLVNGELWPASNIDGESAVAGAAITVVGPLDHQLVVSVLQKS